MRARVITALALIPPVLAAIFCTSPWPILALLLLLGIIGISEVHRLTGQVLAIFGLPFVIAIAAATVAPFFDARSPTNPYGATAIVGVAAFALAIASILAVPAKAKRSHPLALLFGGWLVGPLAALFALHQSPGSKETAF